MTTRSDKSARQLAAQELLAIPGIGPSVARRLADLGLGSLEALAAADAGEVVDGAVDWPSRVTRQRAQDWIDQARRLLAADTPPAAATSRAGRAVRSTTPPARVRHTFTLEVQTNNTSTGPAVATKIIDVESQAFDTWSGWDPERLVRFVAAHSGLEGPITEGRTDRAEPDLPEPASAPGAMRRVIRGYGILDGQTLMAGGRTVHAVLHLGPGDTGADPEARTVEWELAAGPAEGRPTQRLARQHLDLVPGEPVVSAVDLAVPESFRQARLVAVVRILGDGDQPQLAHVLSDSTLELVTLP